MKYTALVVETRKEKNLNFIRHCMVSSLHFACMDVKLYVASWLTVML